VGVFGLFFFRVLLLSPYNLKFPEISNFKFFSERARAGQTKVVAARGNIFKVN